MRRPRRLGIIALLLLLALGLGARAPARSRSQPDFRFEIVAHLGGPSRAVALDGSLALLGEGERLLVVDVSDPGRPARRGASDRLGDTIEDVALHQGRALVAAGTAGLVVLGLADPSRPREIGRHASGRVTQVEVEDDRAYLAANARLEVVDPSDPGSILHLGGYDGALAEWIAVDEGIVWASDRNGVTGLDARRPEAIEAVWRETTRGSLTAIAAEGGRVYLPDSSEGLVVLDARDPRAPVRADVVAADLGIPNDITVAGDRILVVGRRLERLQPFGSTWTGTLTSFSVGPLARREWEVSTGAPAEAVAVSEGRIAVASSADRFERAPRPEAGTGLGLYQGSRRLGGLPTLGLAAGVDVDADRALVGAGSSGAWLYDIADPYVPRLLGIDASPELAGRVEVEAALGWLADGPRAIAYALDGLGAPRRAGTFTAPAAIDDLALPGPFGLLSAGSRASVVDLSDPEAPRERGALMDVGGRLWREGEDRAYVAGMPDALSRLDLADPDRPRVDLGWSPAPPHGAAGALGVDGELAYVGLSVPGWQRVTPPTPRATVTPGGPTVTPTPRLALGSPEAVTTAPPDAGRLRVVALDAQDGPREIGRLELDGPVTALELDPERRRVFTAGAEPSGWGSALLAIDVADPRAPRELGSRIEARADYGGLRAAELAFHRGLLHVAALDEGYWILRPVAPDDPTPTASAPRPSPSATAAPPVARRLYVPWVHARASVSGDESH